jgi:hypothetical protein
MPAAQNELHIVRVPSRRRWNAQSRRTLNATELPAWLLVRLQPRRRLPTRRGTFYEGAFTYSPASPSSTTRVLAIGCSRTKGATLKYCSGTQCEAGPRRGKVLDAARRSALATRPLPRKAGSSFCCVREGWSAARDTGGSQSTRPLCLQRRRAKQRQALRWSVPRCTGGRYSL